MGTTAGYDKLLPEGQSVLVPCHHPCLWLLHVGCLLASENSLSEPRALGLLYSVLGGTIMQPSYTMGIAWLNHVGESFYAMVLCKSKGIMNGGAPLQWFLQTFLFGIASLSILLAY